MVHMDTNRMRITQSAINQSVGFLGDAKDLWGGGVASVLVALRGHKTRQMPRRFKLLVVMLKLLTICDRLAATSSFSSNFPAKPFPSCTPSSSFLTVSVEASMLLTAASICGELVASSARRAVADWFICSEKKRRLLTEALIGGRLVSTSAFTFATMVRERSDTSWRLSSVTERFVSARPLKMVWRGSFRGPVLFGAAGGKEIGR